MDVSSAFRRAARGVLGAAFALVIALIAPQRARAMLCGDDVGGADVPCACGDVVASSVRLDDDPVTTQPCPGTALVVRVPAGGAGARIDLAGHSLRGSGRGIGLWILDGGRDGALVVSTGGAAVIDGFLDGVVAQGATALASIEAVVVRASARDGFRLIDAHGALVRDCEAVDAGRDGFWIGGSDVRVVGTRAVRSGRNGYHVGGMNATLEGNVAEASGAAGVTAMGNGHRFIACQSQGSGGNGFTLHGAHYELADCFASENRHDGINGVAMDWRMAGNRAIDNDHHGLVIRGSGAVDGGGNVGAGNRGLRQRSPAIQCQIGGVPCLP